MTLTENATVTSKGQVTIPKRFRDALDLGEGTEVEFVLEDDGSLSVRPKKPAMERLREVRDRLSGHEVDLEAMRRESKRAWSSHVDGEETT
jgi:AbrB family looped-hinge helix DNA binding protein